MLAGGGRTVHLATRVAALLIVLVAAGCGVNRPPDAVAQSLYARNQSELTFAFTVVGSHDPPVLGELGGEEPRSYGCGWVGRDWQLIITEGSEPPGPADDFVATTSGEDHGDADELAIWIDVQPDGEVTIGEGMPEWWEHEEQRCV